jgi:glutamate/tyrosine decarboxylase-like PLP-dependent enzyme
MTVQKSPDVEHREEDLDPADWAVMRTLAHHMVDDMLEYLQTVRERPVWKPIPEKTRQAFTQSLPKSETAVEAVYKEFREKILPYPLGNIHPRFWGWVVGSGTPLGMLADMLASGMNPNLAGADHAANLVERQVIEWCKQMFDYSTGASGLLVSGGSIANFVALTVARNAKAGHSIRSDGLKQGNRQLTIYGSTETHFSNQRAAEILGLGGNYFRQLPVDDEYKVRVDAVRGAIEQDIKQGLKPICIIGNVGTVNTGAIDPLDEIADIANQYNLWYHIDGAFGAWAYLSPELRPKLKGMNRADSLAFDLHKWGFQPIEVACVLIRDSETHRTTFAPTAHYIKHATRGAAAGSNWFQEYGVQQSRQFRALKVWMAFKVHGVDKLGRMIQQNIDQAKYLAKLVEASPHLQLVAPVPMNIVCFRFTAPELSDEQQNKLNEELLIRLQESGVAVPSSTTLRGRFAIRCAITNQRSRRQDFEILVKEVERIGEQLLREGFE